MHNKIPIELNSRSCRRLNRNGTQSNWNSHAHRFLSFQGKKKTCIKGRGKSMKNIETYALFFICNHHFLPSKNNLGRVEKKLSRTVRHHVCVCVCTCFFICVCANYFMTVSIPTMQMGRKIGANYKRNNCYLNSRTFCNYWSGILN